MIVDSNHIDRAVNVLRASDTISLDTETTGLSEKDRPFSLVAATDEEQFYFDNRVIEDQVIKRVFDDAINGKTLIFQNAKFDMRMIENQWSPVRGNIADIAVLGRLVRNDHLAYNLDAAAKREGMLKTGDMIKDIIKKQKLYTKYTTEFGTPIELLHYDRIPLEQIAPYALNDARITFDLHKTLLPKLDPRAVPVWDMERLLTPVLYKMERRGLQVNVKYTRDAIAKEQSLIREAKSQFLLTTGREYDNKKTTLVDVFKAAGETIPLTEKGNESLTDDVLDGFTTPAAKLVQKIRYHEKRLSTYYINFIELADERGVLHADVWQSGTTTGRLSYRDPNLQNLSKDEGSTDEFVVRGCFRPRPGYVFVAMDYKQVEYRVMLAYAKHYRLIDQVMAGADVHQAMADMVGIKRSEAKTLNFAILYGAGVDKIASMLGISIEQAQELKRKYFGRLLEVQLLIKQIIKKGEGCGYVYNWLGRKLHVNHRDFCYKLPNYLIQGSAADICKLAMLELDAALKDYDCHMVLQVHDAVYFEMRKEDMAHLAPKLKQIMINVFPAMNGMCMDVDVQWSDVSLAERDMKAYG